MFKEGVHHTRPPEVISPLMWTAEGAGVQGWGPPGSPLAAKTQQELATSDVASFKWPFPCSYRPATGSTATALLQYPLCLGPATNGLLRTPSKCPYIILVLSLYDVSEVAQSRGSTPIRGPSARKLPKPHRPWESGRAGGGLGAG